MGNGKEKIAVFLLPTYKDAVRAARRFALNCGCDVELERNSEQEGAWFISLPKAKIAGLRERDFEIFCGRIEAGDLSDEPNPYGPGAIIDVVYEEETYEDRMWMDSVEPDEDE